VSIAVPHGSKALVNRLSIFSNFRLNFDKRSGRAQVGRKKRRRAAFEILNSILTDYSALVAEVSVVRGEIDRLASRPV